MNPMATSMPVPHVKWSLLASSRSLRGWRRGMLVLLIPAVVLGIALAATFGRPPASPSLPSQPTSLPTRPAPDSGTDRLILPPPDGGLTAPTNAGASQGALAPVPESQAGSGRGPQASYRLCGTADAPAAEAIGRLIAGRPFSARLVGRDDGCADLTISVAPVDATTGRAPAGIASTRQSTRLAVSVPAGPGGQAGSRLSGSKTISVAIVSENGTTHVTVGSGSER